MDLQADRPCKDVPAQLRNDSAPRQPSFHDTVDLLHMIEPDVAVVFGAADHAWRRFNAPLCNDLNLVPCFDVLPLSIGIETSGGLFTKIIPVFTFIPAYRSQL